MKSELITNVTPLGWHIACERIMVPALLIYANDNEKSTLYTLAYIPNLQKKNHINITKNKKLTSDSGHTPSSHTETTTAQHPFHIIQREQPVNALLISTQLSGAEEMHIAEHQRQRRTKCGIQNLFLCEL